MRLRPLRPLLAGLLAGAPADPALACPDRRLNGQPVPRARASSMPRSPSRGQRNEADIGPCPVPGPGHVMRAPRFTIRHDRRGRSRDRAFRADSACDSILRVNLPDGS